MVLLDVVGGEHLADDLLLEGVHLVLGFLDFLEEGRVFLVGLDFAELALELGDLAFDVLDVALEIPPPFLVLGESFLGRRGELGALAAIFRSISSMRRGMFSMKTVSCLISESIS